MGVRSTTRPVFLVYVVKVGGRIEHQTVHFSEAERLALRLGEWKREPSHVEAWEAQLVRKLPAAEAQEARARQT